MMENQTSKESRQIVLVVDDGPENLAVIGELLRPNYSIQVANNGERALQLAKGESRPDLILLDVMMPGMDGHRVLQELKDTPRTAEIPVIFLTARSNEEDQLKGFELGAVDAIKGQALTVHLPAFAGSEVQKVVVDYSTRPDAAALQWLSPQQTAGGQKPYLFSQGQAILTRTWVPPRTAPAFARPMTPASSPPPTCAW